MPSLIINVTTTVSPISPPFKNLWWLADGASCRRRLHVDLFTPQQDADNRLELVGVLRQLAATGGLGLRNAPAVRRLLQRGAGISVRSRLPGARPSAQSNVPAQAAPRALWRSLLAL